MYKLPPKDSEIRGMIDIETLAAIGSGERKAPGFTEAFASARRQFEADTAVVSVTMLMDTPAGLMLVESARNYGPAIPLWYFG